VSNRYLRPSLMEMQRQVELFNHGIPEGSPVTYKRDDGSVLRTKTRSSAYMMSGHTPVVFVDGIAGCVLLNRVSPITAPSAPSATAVQDQPTKKDSQR